MRPAFAGKCMAVALACVHSAAEPVRVLRRFGFPKTSRGKCTWMLCCCKSFDAYTCHCLGFGKWKIESEEGQLLEWALQILLSSFLPLAGAGFLLHWVMAAMTFGSWPPRASHKASEALTIASAVFWILVPTASRMEGGSQIKNIARIRSLSGLTPCGRCCLSFPMRTLGLRPCISMGSQSSSKYGCHLLFPNCPSKTSFKRWKGWSDSL